MKNFSKILALILCFAVALTLLVGCTKDNGKADNTESIGSNASVTSNTGDNSNTSSTVSATSSSRLELPDDILDDTSSDNTSSNVSTDSGSSTPTTSESGTTPPSENEPEPTITLNAAQNGDIVTVTASIKNNTGLVAFKFIVNFDKDKLTPDSLEQSALKLGITSNLKNGADKSGKASALYVHTAGFSDNGDLFTFKFKVKDSAKGKTDFTITSDDVSFLSLDAKTYLKYKTYGTSLELK